MVLGFHATALTMNPHQTGLSYEPLRKLEQWGFLGVQVFFVVSGYCIAAASHATRGEGPARTFLRRRLHRIFPPYWGMLAVLCAIGLVGILLRRGGLENPLFNPFVVHDGPPGSPPGPPIGVHWLTNVTLTETTWLAFGRHCRYANQVSWSLCYELQFYLMAALLLVARTPRRIAVGLAAMSLATIVVRAFPAFYPRGFLFDRWFEFACGLWLYWRLTGPGGHWALLVDGLALGALVLHYAAHVHGADATGIGQEAKTPFFCAGVAVLLFALRRSGLDGRLETLAPVRALSWVGTRSYSVYLIHYPIVMSLAAWEPVRRIEGGYGLYGIVFVMCALSLLAAEAFHRGVERRFLNAPRPGGQPLTRSV
jgi:peptidoglycan/LPS O-acetylase OafA/YrhL